MPKLVLIPLPAKDFDPTESAVPWKVLTENGINVCFATPNGQPALCDERMLTGKNLGPLALLLSADKNGRRAYQQMQQSHAFRNPIPWDQIRAEQYGGLVLPGGHAPGMKAYLESIVLQDAVAKFFLAEKPVGAICHGAVLAARSQLNGASVLAHRKTTALLASQEISAWLLTCTWLGNYYRTYPQTVEAEVRRALVQRSQFVKGPPPILRDSPENPNRGFAVRDGRYLSARWPGDAHRFALDFLQMLQQPATT